MPYVVYFAWYTNFMCSECNAIVDAMSAVGSNDKQWTSTAYLQEQLQQGMVKRTVGSVPAKI